MNAITPLARRYRLGFDIGGTFTDFVLVDSVSGRFMIGKCLTTPHDPSEAVQQGIADLLRDAGVKGSGIEIAIHATTLITNALIERRGAKTALLATQGFRDTLEMGTEVRYDNYAIRPPMPTPLVPRELRFDVPERLSRDGDVLQPLDREAVAGIAERLREAGVAAVGIVYLHSFRDPTHECETEAILRAALPGVSISRSSAVAPEIREFERTSTTVANAYVQPIVATYLDRTQARLNEAGYERSLYIMVSSGGVAGARTVRELPIRMLESGPTAGVLAAIYFGRKLDFPDLVTFDMGGTTAKIGLTRDHQAKKSNVFEFGRAARFMKGSGLPVNIPMIELIEIGAGGGSIAQCDKLGLLAVGPQSAGSDPGPACYGRGGKLPTVTDANLILGYLSPDYFLGGALKLDVAAARRAFEDTLCGPLGMSVEACARGIYRVVNHNMLGAAKVHIAERGQDPRNLRMFAFGGAGPAHAYELARAMQMRGVIIPPGAGATSALGLVVSAVSFDFSHSCPHLLDRADWADIAPVFTAMEEEGLAVLRDAGIEGGRDIAVMTYRMDIRHAGQGREISVEIPADLIAAGDLAGIRECFYREHLGRFGHVHRHVVPELMTCRLTVAGPDTGVAMPSTAGTESGPALKGRRAVYFIESEGYVDTPVFERSRLPAGFNAHGPAIIEERECTVVAGPSATIRVDENGTLFLDL